MKTKAKDAFAEVFAEFSNLPFLFVGAGISRRYLGTPGWKDLLGIFAERVHPGNPLALQVFTQGDEEVDWPEVSTRIEKEYNQVWLTDNAYKKEREKHQEAVQQGASPFKLSLADFFATAKRQTKDQHLLDELSCLTNVGKRSIAGVITTNYDMLLDEVFSGYHAYVGQEELLFKETQGVAEIYKIHGCCTKPESVVINAKDYEAFNDRNAYLAAKLLTVFVEHPIIFLGYSISDPNVQSILKAITACLSQERLSQLQKRLIFVEFSSEEMEEPRIQGHSINFDTGGESLEMTRITLNDFLPLYSELLSRTYKYNPKLLRQLKRDIYKLITTNEPVDRFMIVDIENDKELEKVRFLAGVGIGPEPFANGGHNLPSAEELFVDIIFDDKEFDIKSLVETCLGPLLKHHSRSLPVHKYISAYKDQFKKEAPAEVIADAKQFDGLLNEALRKRRNENPIGSFAELEKEANGDDLKIIGLLPVLRDIEKREKLLCDFIKKFLKKSPDALTGKNQALKTNLKRIIKIYDYLRYGKEKGAPTT